MVVGQTRKQLRVDVGDNLDAVELRSISGTGSGSNKTDFDDDELRGGDDEHNGKRLWMTSGSNEEETTYVNDYVVANNRVTVLPAVVGANFAANDTYEMWGRAYDPVRINRYINQAIVAATRRVYDPIENITLFADGVQSRFDIPSNIFMIKELSYRYKFKGKVIDGASSAWTAGSNVTVAIDTELFKRGSSNKLALAAGVAAGGVIAYKDISSIDLSDYTHIEWWARCSKTTAAADLKLLLDNTAGATSPIELLNFPVLTADTWTFCRVALAKADEDIAILSVGVEDDVDIGAETVWIDDVRAVHNDEMFFQPIQRHLWHIDKEARDIILTEDGRSRAGYAMLKIRGGDNPATLTADATATEMDDRFIVAYATALAFAAVGEGGQAGFWFGEANRARRALPFLANVRRVA